MDEKSSVEALEPRLENGHFLLIAGLGSRFTAQTIKDIPQLWERFIPEIGHIPGQKSEATYGICFNRDDKGGFEYVAGVEIGKLDDLPEKYRWVEVQPQQYAVFEYTGSLDKLPEVFQYIWKTWLPQSGRTAANAPEFERYSEDYNPRLKTGVLEIWLPLEP